MSDKNKIIPYGKQHITEEDIKEVEQVLRSDFLTQGPKVKEFEENFAEYIGSKYAIAVANGTAALHLSALAMNIQPGDKVITTPITFAASANCVLYTGGEVDFVDIDPDTYLMDLDKLEQKLESNPSDTYKGIIPVDFAGYPIDMERVKKIADRYNLWIIEDACHAPGGYFMDSNGNKQFCGNGKLSDLTIFSFHPVKHIATAEGGMITTNNETLYKKLLMLRTHGITKDNNSFQNPINTACGNVPKSNGTKKITNDQYPGWYYEMQTLGYNYRLSDIHAALGVSQLKNAGERLKRRKEIANKYQKAFINKQYIKGQSGVVEGHGYHLYIIETEHRKVLYEYLRYNKIFTQIHYLPVHLMPYYKQFGWKVGDMPKAENYYKQCLSLPMYPSLKEEEQTNVVKYINAFFNNKNYNDV